MFATNAREEQRKQSNFKCLYEEVKGHTKPAGRSSYISLCVGMMRKRTNDDKQTMKERERERVCVCVCVVCVCVMRLK